MNSTMLVAAILYMALGVIVALEIKRCPKRVEPVALLILALHGIVYYFAIIYDFEDGALTNPLFWNLWSSTLRFHSILTIMSIEFFRLVRLRRGSSGCQ